MEAASVFTDRSAGRRLVLALSAATGMSLLVVFSAFRHDSALGTEQLGFIPGCLVSAAVQLYSFLRNSSPTRQMEAMA